MMRAALRLASMLVLLGAGVAQAEDKVGKDCIYKGKKLWGKVQVVQSGADLKIQVVTSFADFKVQKVTSFPDSCGKWQTVNSFPDLKVQIVTSFPDLKIMYVGSFPGVP
ncbi:MAG TPA: hypothetical protein VJ890_23770 [Vineibacter sp.]|nr:hypothetical protein [Vineibacter sp.]